jgi:hypothetical protein
MTYNSSRLPLITYVSVAALIGAWLCWDSAVYRLITYSLWADYWEHAAALTEWMRNLGAPGNPHLAGGSSSSRYVPILWVLAAIGQATGLSAIDLMALGAVINYSLLAVAIYLFCKEYFQNEWAPVVAFLVLFMGWGVPWVWANLYQLRSFFMVASYPSTFVFALSLISFWYSLKFLRCKTGVLTGLFSLLFLSALMFVSHPLTGVFAIAGCCLLACTERDAPLSLRVMIIITMLAGALLADLWPYFSIWDVVLNKSEVVDDRTWQSFQGVGAMLDRARSGDWWHMLYDPRQLVVGLGFALIGLPILMWMLVKRKQPFILLGAALMAAPYFGNVFYQVALAHRFLFYLVFFMHLAIIWAVQAMLARWQQASATQKESPGLRAGVFATAALFGVVGIANVALLTADYRGQHLNQKLELIDKRQFLPTGMTVTDVYTRLTRDIPESAIVIGNPLLTWPLPTFRGKVVSLPENHENSLVPDEAERTAAERTFMSADATVAERIAIVNQYRVSHVLINPSKTEPELINWLEGSGQLIAEVGNFQMFVLKADRS